MKLSKLITSLQQIEIEANGIDLEVITVHGASGTPADIGHAFVRESDEEMADTMGWLPGYKYVEIYIGN